MDLAELVEQRKQALLRRWARGDRLNESEMAEIQDRLPAPVIEGEAPVSGPAVGDGRKKDDGYQRKIADYAKFYETHPRTVKTWIGKGRHAKGGPDFPPLDNPALMPLWWPRHHKWRVPDRLLALAAEAGAPMESEPGAARAETVLPAGSGFAAEIERVRAAAQRAAANLEVAETGGNASEIDLATRRYERASKQLREYERDAAKVLEAQGRLVSVDVLEPIVREAHVAIETRLRASLNRVDPLLREERDLPRRQKIWNDHLDRLFEDLHRVRWRLAAEEEVEP